MKLSVVIPARDEAGSIEATVRDIVAMLVAEDVEHEVLVIDDHSRDRTPAIVAALGEELATVRCLPSPYGAGFGLTVRAGLESFDGTAVAVFMADGSDDARDLVRYVQVLEQGYDCVFGSRFMPGASVRGYPRVKRVINRVVNLAIQALFRHGYNDTTNAFKAYRREVIENVAPLLSNHFNLTVELPLKAIVRGHSYAIVPIAWSNRLSGESKLGLNEMGSRYLFSLVYVFLEDHLTRGDYRRPGFDRSAGRGRAPALRIASDERPPEAPRRRR